MVTGRSDRPLIEPKTTGYEILGDVDCTGYVQEWACRCVSRNWHQRCARAGQLWIKRGGKWLSPSFLAALLSPRGVAPNTEGTF
jgi:hypothetical protein